MRKLTRKNLDELAKVMPALNEHVMGTYIGGGNGSQADPYTELEFDNFLSSGYFPGGYVLFGNDTSGVYISASYGCSGIEVTPNNGSTGNELPLIPINSDIATPLGSILSITEETMNKGGKYVKVLNYGLIISQYYNSAANIYNSKELSANEVYDISINTIGLAGSPGAVVATVIDFYKKGFEYFVKLKVELDHYIEDQLNPATGMFYPY